MHFFIVPVTDQFPAIRIRDRTIYFTFEFPNLTFWHSTGEHVHWTFAVLCWKLFVHHGKIWKAPQCLKNTYNTAFDTVFTFILGSSQPLIPKEASIFSWLPPVPCSSHWKLPLRCIILYTLQSHTLHHKVIHSSLLTHPAHVPVSFPHFLSHCTNPVLHFVSAKASALCSLLCPKSGSGTWECVKEQAVDTGYY